ncbi:MAG: acriflavine resistance protein B, partial [Myxococcales bacterium]
IRRDPDVDHVASFIGVDGSNATLNGGRFSISLKPREHRASAADITARLSRAAQGVAGVNLYLQSVQDLQIDSSLSRTQYQFTLEGTDADELEEAAGRLLTELRKHPVLADVATDLSAGAPTLSLEIDRDTASRLGVTAQAIDDTLYDAFGQRQIQTIFTQLNLYRVILEVSPELRSDTGALGRLYARSTAGSLVPLSAFVRTDRHRAPLTVRHQGQFPVVTLSFNLAPGASLGEAIDAIHASQAAIDLPPAIRGEFQGAAEAFQVSLASEPFLILAALITVYIVLGILYESFIHPITILSTLPSAGLGALIALRLTGTEFSVIALIGIILLIGIVKKNAIMMIDFALEAGRGQGRQDRDRVDEALVEDAEHDVDRDQ